MSEFPTKFDSPKSRCPKTKSCGLVCAAERNAMIELYAFSKIVEPINLNSAVYWSLKIPLDLDSSKALKYVPFIVSIFTNERYDGACGTPRVAHFLPQWPRNAIVFTSKDLEQLWHKYSAHLAERSKHGCLPGAIETALSSFINMSVSEKLEMISVSELILQEYE